MCLKGQTETIIFLNSSIQQLLYCCVVYKWPNLNSIDLLLKTLEVGPLTYSLLPNHQWCGVSHSCWSILWWFHPNKLKCQASWLPLSELTDKSIKIHCLNQLLSWPGGMCPGSSLEAFQTNTRPAPHSQRAGRCSGPPVDTDGSVCKKRGKRVHISADGHHRVPTLWLYCDVTTAVCYMNSAYRFR